MYSKKDASRVYSPVGTHPAAGKSNNMRRYLAGAAVLAIVFFIWRLTAGGGGSSSHADLHVATWNIAAINNNPFEYWITHDDPAYNNMMDAVQVGCGGQRLFCLCLFACLFCVRVRVCSESASRRALYLHNANSNCHAI